MPKGLYLHIPFCETRCHYCNFVTTAEHSPDLRVQFFRALISEMAKAREVYGRLSFDTLYLGGGTPSCLSIAETEKLVGEIRNSFDLHEGFEFTCEFNPGDGDQGKLDAFRSLGVNRISLGCQAFQDVILQRLGRRHTVQDIVETLGKIRQAGISNISFDLMLRLPGQTVGNFRDSVRQCIDLGASQVSLYDLEIHQETPFGQLQEKEGLDLPTGEEHAAMYGIALEILPQAGYEHYEISNFARPGLASQHNLLYWHNQEYLGLGPGAFSYLNGVRYQFAANLGSYLEKCGRRDWTNDTEDVLSEEEKETETFVTGLRLSEGVCPEDFTNLHPQMKERVQKLCREGLAEQVEEKLRLTARGKFLSEDVFGFLLQKEGTPNTAFL